MLRVDVPRVLRPLPALLIGGLVLGGLLVASCVSSIDPADQAEAADDGALSTTAPTISPTTDSSATTAPTVPPPTAAPPTTTPPTIAPRQTLAGGVDAATVATDLEGAVVVQSTPPALRDRRLATVDVLPPPTDDVFTWSVEPFEGEPLARSTWREGCPVDPTDLRYITVSFFGFDGDRHTGELVVAADQATAIVEVFRTLHDAEFPIEEMRVITPEDIEAVATGDANNTGSFVCREVTGGTRFSEHAFGLAIDVNPFHNPYQRGDVVLPELASSYLDRSVLRPGMILSDGDVVKAFAAVGWEWGGNWNSLTDYHHFALNNR